MEGKSRRQALKKLGTGASLFAINPLNIKANDMEKRKLKSNINHSVCRWCYSKIGLEDLCVAAKKIGLKSIELVGPGEWSILKKHGLHCAMPNGGEIGLDKGFNHEQYHEQLFKKYSEIIPKVAEAGYDKIICFSGNRAGISEEEGLEVSAKGLKPLMPIAEKYKVTMVMELLNSKVNHKDYQCDHTSWGVELCKMVGSDRFKLLYDIYHMQIMEGDVIATIKANHEYIAHYHTGGVPGRHEIDTTQELYYPAIMQAILDTGYKGYVAQEFIPAKPDALASLEQGVRICDV
ncbi:MAG: TIM barrel protein [Saprospiraceae bacterium]|nr:TIM barrel protein [Saprospiraceae bacterium]MBK7436581.1 TIM barrel protein [Saprospiraceae bacterium]MBL0113570.1 TIM barrel protein [Saprospiraceae bacterium]